MFDGKVRNSYFRFLFVAFGFYITTFVAYFNMHLTRSFALLSSVLIYTPFASAAVANPLDDGQSSPLSPRGLLGHVKSLMFGKRQQVCRDDAWAQAIQNQTLAYEICGAVIGPAVVTEVVEITPTTYDIRSTSQLIKHINSYLK